MFVNYEFQLPLREGQMVGEFGEANVIDGGFEVIMNDGGEFHTEYRVLAEFALNNGITDGLLPGLK